MDLLGVAVPFVPVYTLTGIKVLTRSGESVIRFTSKQIDKILLEELTPSLTEYVG